MPLKDRHDYLVFNTLSGAAALIDSRIKNILEKGLSAAGGDYLMLRSPLKNPAETREAVVRDYSVSQTMLSELLKLGILVDSPEEETRRRNDLLRRYFQPNTLKLTIATTAGCQLRCAYCFQSGRDESLCHDVGLADQIESWVNDYLDSHPHIDCILLGLFGGEPLLFVPMADLYIDKLRSVAARRGLSFSFSLTTNGLELTENLILFWAEYGLTDVRVTLDGPADIHDKRRPMVSGAGSLSRIIDRLSASTAVEGVEFGVSINLDQGNVDGVGALLELLEERGLKERIEVMLEPVLPASSNLSESNALLDHRKAGALLVRALEQVIERGFATPLYPGLCQPCNFVRSNSFIIDWSGGLFRCSFSMMTAKMSVGDAWKGVSEFNEELLRMSRHVTSYCLKTDCPFLPVCFGGCRYWSFCLHSDWSQICCPVEVWEQALPLSVTHAFDFKPISAAGRFA